jgi:hypothetical protein
MSDLGLVSKAAECCIADRHQGWSRLRPRKHDNIFSGPRSERSGYREPQKAGYGYAASCEIICALSMRTFLSAYLRP